MTNFIEQLELFMNLTKTLNGAKTHMSSGDAVLDFFAMGGSTRKDLILGRELFLKAYATDKEKAVRVLFYLRDIREGQGERDLFRLCLAYIAIVDFDTFTKLVDLVGEYGRYDDLLPCLQVSKEVQTLVCELFKTRLADDYKALAENKPISLLAKWMPSSNTSSKTTRKYAEIIMNSLGISQKEYRKMLSKLRKEINIVETTLSKREYSVVDYSKLPSQAGMKYRKAFKKNDEPRYTAYLESVKKGEAKINTATLYTYQIYNAVKRGDDIQALDVIWKNLPDYTQGKNALVVADVSGSMSGDPMSVSVSLAMYFAERNKGTFKDYFITFSNEPTLQKVVGNDLREKMNNLERAQWDMNTDLFKVFLVILETAVQNRTPVEEMPATIYIVSDMEFDSACENTTNLEAIKMAYASNNYPLPTLVFWNVDAKSKQSPVKKDERGVTLVSGLSTNTFRLVMENKSPIELMNEVIEKERYCKILS